MDLHRRVNGDRGRLVSRRKKSTKPERPTDRSKSDASSNGARNGSITNERISRSLRYLNEDAFRPRTRR